MPANFILDLAIVGKIDFLQHNFTDAVISREKSDLKINRSVKNAASRIYHSRLLPVMTPDFGW